MMKFSTHDLYFLLLFLSTTLIGSKFLNELFKKFNLPSLLSEISLGIILGPTIFGNIFPEISSQFYLNNSSLKVALDSLISLSVIMFLFISGMEIELELLLKKIKPIIFTSLGSILIPFVTGFATAWFLPNVFEYDESKKLIYSIFFGIAMAISALPVIMRILSDLKILNTDVGIVVIASALVSDIVVWVKFSFILKMLGKGDNNFDLNITIFLLIIFLIFCLTIGKKVINRLLYFINDNFSNKEAILSISLGICFLFSSFTEYIGLHAIVGAFFAGIIFSDLKKINNKVESTLISFINNIFTPLFFVSLGLRVNFIQNFDFKIVMLVLIVSIFCKILGSFLGSLIGGLNVKESIAVGFGLNARGTMGIILSTLALNSGLINEKIFIAIVIMSLVTSIIADPMMRKFLVIKD